MNDLSTEDASKLLSDAAAALKRGELERASDLVDQAFAKEPGLKKRKAPHTLEELRPLLRRKDAAGKVMRQLRQSLGLTMERVAEICDVHKSAVGFWETGRNAVSEEAISRLLAYMSKVGVEAIDQEKPLPQAFLKLRQQLGLTPMALAAKLGIKETALRRIETGNMEPSIVVIEGYRKLAQERGLELDEAA